MNSTKKSIKVIDLFSGCGGMSLGFIDAGFNLIAGFDNWEPAISVYKKNFTHPIYKRDLSDSEEIIDQLSELSLEVIIGGPPCQDFSSAGHRDESLGRANLTFSFTNCK